MEVWASGLVNSECRAREEILRSIWRRLPEDIKMGPGTKSFSLAAGKACLQNSASGICSHCKNRDRWSDPVALVISGTRGRLSLFLFPAWKQEFDSHCGLSSCLCLWGILRGWREEMTKKRVGTLRVNRELWDIKTNPGKSGLPE